MIISHGRLLISFLLSDQNNLWINGCKDKYTYIFFC